MIWRRLEGGDWYVPGGHFWRKHDSDVVWWVGPVYRERREA